MSADDPVDVIVVGSGPSGAQATQTLVEAGLRVRLLDVGFQPDTLVVPERPFVELRKEDREQHAYLLGHDFSGVPQKRVGTAPQVMPTRRHVFRSVKAGTIVTDPDFVALESHALGGLGGAWGAVSFPLLDEELRRCGLPVGEMRTSYERVARRVGISGERDDLLSMRGPLDALLPAVGCDHNAEAAFARYRTNRAWFARNRIVVGRPLLAMLSQDLEGRRAHAGLDLDFWSNAGESVYRPELTIATLQRGPRFQYCPGWIVERFSEDASGVSVHARRCDGDESRSFRAQKLVLAAGALGTARLALRSLGSPEQRLPLACNAHLYVPCLHVAGLGRPHAERCHSLAQLTMIHDPSGNPGELVQAQLYSYRSLLLFRLLPDVPLPQREALRILRAVAPSLAIWAVEHADEPGPGSSCRLLPDGRLAVEHRPDSATERRRRAVERTLMHGMRRLGLWPIRRVFSGAGSSLHYGGQLPASERDEPMTCDHAGRLRGTRGVHVVDGAALRYLPAKGPTFTLMANADRIARSIAAAVRT